jgi:hypothetical protein
MQANHADYFNFTFRLAGRALYQAPIFTSFQGGQYYWTSTTGTASPTHAWTVFSCDFGVYAWPKGGTGYTLAVR